MLRVLCSVTSFDRDKSKTVGLFEVMGIPLLHGWLANPEHISIYSDIRGYNYEMLQKYSDMLEVDSDSNASKCENLCPNIIHCLLIWNCMACPCILLSLLSLSLYSTNLCADVLIKALLDAAQKQLTPYGYVFGLIGHTGLYWCLMHYNLLLNCTAMLLCAGHCQMMLQFFTGTKNLMSCTRYGLPIPFMYCPFHIYVLMIQ